MNRTPLVVRIVSFPVLLFVTAVTLRIVAILVVQSHRFPALHYDSLQIAHNLARGMGYSYAYVGGEPLVSSFKGPLFVLFAAGFLSLGQSPLVFFVMQATLAILGGVTCLLLWRIGSRHVSPAVGIVAACAYALNPGAIVMATRMHEINITVLVFAFCILQLFELYRDTSLRRGIMAGFAAGLCLLTEPTFTVLVGLALAFIVLSRPREFWRRVGIAVTVGLVALTVLTPWMVRNALAHGRFVPTKSSFGMALWIGHSPQANGSAFVKVDRDPDARRMPILKTMDPALRKRVLAASTELERDALLRDAALAQIRSNPGRSLRLALTKASLLWWYDPYHPLAHNLIYRTVEQCIFLTGVVGALVAWRKRRFFAYLLLALIMTHTMVYMVFFVLPRYRLNSDPFLLLGGAALLVELVRRIPACRGALARLGEPG